MQGVTLKEIVVETLDGDWGSDDGPAELRFRVVRGTDFEALARGDASGVPTRYLSGSSKVRRTLRVGDVLIETAGGSPGRPTGRTMLVTTRALAALGSQATCASFARFLRPDSAKVNSTYLHYRLMAAYRAGIMEAFQVQHTGVARFQFTTFASSYRMTIPSLGSQAAIAEVLGALDDKIAANAAISRSGEALLTAEFLKLQAQQGMRPWRLDELVDLNPRCAPVTAGEPIYVDMQKLPTIGAHAASWDRREARGGARFMKGDTLLARITPCLENRKTGFVDFLAEGETGIGSTEFIVLRSKPGIAKSLSFLIAVDEGFRAHAIQHMVGTSGRQRVSASDLAEYEFRLPSDPTALVQLGSRADALLALGAAQRTESRRLAELRDTLLPHLMSGRITVREAEKQVEEAV